MNRLAPAFVVTLGVTSACASGTPSPAVASEYPRSLNALDPEHGTIYVASDGSCYVELPFTEPPTSGGQPRPQRAVACPLGMRDPAWAECVDAEMLTDESGNDCVCDVRGNPPPPTVSRVSCPR